MITRSHLDIGMDREIISIILNHICSTDKRENKCAKLVYMDSDNRISKDDFHNWISAFNVKNIK